jgi:excinuclease UvrABC nuclease subunit
MIYNGHKNYTAENINNLNPQIKGVYYLGYIDTSNKLQPLYIGKGTGKEGIRNRITTHYNERKWSGITHFGFEIINNDNEALNRESLQINYFKPKYNIQGK